MALNSLSCADVPLSNYSLTHSPGDFDYLQPCFKHTWYPSEECRRHGIEHTIKYSVAPKVISSFKIISKSY